MKEYLIPCLVGGIFFITLTFLKKRGKIKSIPPRMRDSLVPGDGEGKANPSPQG